MVKIMARHNLVFDAFVVELNRVVSVVATELKEVFNNKLFIFAPSNL